jgi:hypothetical protein
LIAPVTVSAGSKLPCCGADHLPALWSPRNQTLPDRIACIIVVADR